MTAIKGTNSYVSLDEADTYFETRLRADDWFETDCEEKEIALVTATSMIDHSRWAGQAVSETQALAWPRIGSVFDPRLGKTVNFVSTATEAPQEVQDATCELALHLIQNPTIMGKEIGTTATTTTPDEISVGSISLKGLKETEEVPVSEPLRIKKLYSKYLNNGGSRNWYRSN